MLTVSDNGIGIPPEDLGIFDPFFTDLPAGNALNRPRPLLAREACDRLAHDHGPPAPGGDSGGHRLPRDTSIFAGMPSSVTATKCKVDRPICKPTRWCRLPATDKLT